MDSEEVLHLLDIDMFADDSDEAGVGGASFTDIGIARNIVEEEPAAVFGRYDALGADNVVGQLFEGSFNFFF